MTKDEALLDLLSPLSHKRIEAVRFFIVNGNENDLTILRKARQAETDTYVQKRLDQALNQLSLAHASTELLLSQEEVTEEENDQDTLGKAYEWVGGLFLHEMEGPIGRASLYASKDIPDYPSSKTKKEIDTLKSVFGCIEQLVKVSKPPRPRQVDLSLLIQDVVSTEIDSSINLSIYGTKPFVVVTDPDFLKLALSNGLRNAAEAITQFCSLEEQHPIVVTWGETDRDYWISVIDHGAGIQGKVSSNFEIGKSTKSGHRGFGLTIARRAMEAIHGTVALQSETGVGARYELRWERKN